LYIMAKVKRLKYIYILAGAEGSTADR